MLVRVCVAIVHLCFCTASASAHGSKEQDVRIAVDLSSKHMTVFVGNEKRYTWNVAIGPGQSTRPGEFRVQSLSPDHHSSIYNNEPMPHSIFYDGNRAIHGTGKKIAGHKTHGCIALTRQNAQALFKLVSRNRAETRITVKR